MENLFLNKTYDIYINMELPKQVLTVFIERVVYLQLNKKKKSKKTTQNSVKQIDFSDLQER